MQDLAAPIRALTGLQCLRLSLHTHSGNWSWLRELHHLTGLHLSTHGMLALYVRQTDGTWAWCSYQHQQVCTRSVQMSQICKGHVLYVCAGYDSSTFDFHVLGHLTTLQKVSLRFTHEHTPQFQRTAPSTHAWP